MRPTALCLAFVCATSAAGNTGTDHNALRGAILAADADLATALNTRNIDILKRRFSESLEFYHDQGGISDYAGNLRNFERNFSQRRTIRRETMNDTVEVFPAGPDAAMQIGSHRFCSAPEPGAQESCSVYRFSHVWRKEGGEWRLARVLSYGH